MSPAIGWQPAPPHDIHSVLSESLGHFLPLPLHRAHSTNGNFSILSKSTPFPLQIQQGLLSESFGHFRPDPLHLAQLTITSEELIC